MSTELKMTAKKQKRKKAGTVVAEGRFDSNFYSCSWLVDLDDTKGNITLLGYLI